METEEYVITTTSDPELVSPFSESEEIIVPLDLASPGQEAVTTTAIVETAVSPTGDPELLQSVKNIESTMSYFLGFTVLITSAFFCWLIIKIFFGRR